MLNHPPIRFVAATDFVFDTSFFAADIACRRHVAMKQTVEIEWIIVDKTSAAECVADIEL